jgi:hypothetical protein
MWKSSSTTMAEMLGRLTAYVPTPTGLQLTMTIIVTVMALQSTTQGQPEIRKSH